MRLPVLLGLAIIGLTIYKFTSISNNPLPGASLVAEEQAPTGVEGIVKGVLKSNRVVVFSKVKKIFGVGRDHKILPPSA
jgi:hypothetical protein